MLRMTYSTVTRMRVPEQRVLEEPGEVVEADERRCPEQVVPGQTEVEAADEGVEVEHQEADQCRQDEDQSDADVTPAGRLVSSPDAAGLVVSCNKRFDGVDAPVLMRLLPQHKGSEEFGEAPSCQTSLSVPLGLECASQCDAEGAPQTVAMGRKLHL